MSLKLSYNFIFHGCIGKRCTVLLNCVSDRFCALFNLFTIIFKNKYNDFFLYLHMTLVYLGLISNGRFVVSKLHTI